MDFAQGSDPATGGDPEGVAAESNLPAETDIHAFLIADVRGYTAFTQARGDEAAARLAARFAEVARTTVREAGGNVLELRGDEALCVFASPRAACRAAIELQDRFLEETRSDPSLPLAVGIGLDAGEAVAVEGGYRGGALNVAARLCSIARAGEILASRELVYLARRIEGLVFAERGKADLKGLDRPVHIVQVRAADRDVAGAMAQFVQSARKQPRGRRRSVVAAVAAVVAVVIASSILVGLGDTETIASGPDTVIVIDPQTNEIVNSVNMGAGARPGPITVDDEGSAWVANLGTKTITRINPQDDEQQPAFSPGGTPTGIAAGLGKVWVALEFDDRVSVLDPVPILPSQEDSIPAPGAERITVGFDSVWVTSNTEEAVYRIDPTTHRVIETISLPKESLPLGIAAGADGVWVADSLQTFVSKIDPASNVVEAAQIPLGPYHPNEVAVGENPVAVWVTSTRENSLFRIDPATNGVVTKTVGSGPIGVAIAKGSVWVACSRSRSVWRLDAVTGGVIEKIPVQGSPHGVAVVGGTIWVTVQ